MAQDEIVKKISDQEMEATYSGPAVLANRFFITMGPWGVRFAFAEQYSTDKPPLFRTAVTMSYPDTANFIKVLGAMMARNEHLIFETEQND